MTKLSHVVSGLELGAFTALPQENFGFHIPCLHVKCSDRSHELCGTGISVVWALGEVLTDLLSFLLNVGKIYLVGVALLAPGLGLQLNALDFAQVSRYSDSSIIRYCEGFTKGRKMYTYDLVLKKGNLNLLF